MTLAFLLLSMFFCWVTVEDLIVPFFDGFVDHDAIEHELRSAQQSMLAFLAFRPLSLKTNTFTCTDLSDPAA